MKEKIDNMREWAQSRARMASNTGEEVEHEATPLEMAD
jgi:hypothetical protein